MGHRQRAEDPYKCRCSDGDSWPGLSSPWLCQGLQTLCSPLMALPGAAQAQELCWGPSPSSGLGWGHFKGSFWGTARSLRGEVGWRMGPASTVPGTGLESKCSQGMRFASSVGLQDLQACSGYGICMHGPSRAPTGRPCPPGLLHVPTEVGDCVTFLSTANFSSTSYTMYTCCKQLFARWVRRAPEP